MASTAAHALSNGSGSAGSVSETLERLVIDLGRSLLQYVDECWPWSSLPTDETDAARKKIAELAALQRSGVARLTDLLSRRKAGWIDFGTYPTDYTDLHYCALDFLLRQLVAGASALATRIEAARAACTHDAAAAALLERVAADQRKIIDELRTIRAPRATVNS